MSESMFLTVYFENKDTYDDIKNILNKARDVFRHVWNQEYTGIDKYDRIIGLASLFGHGETVFDELDSKESILKTVEEEGCTVRHICSLPVLRDDLLDGDDTPLRNYWFQHCNGCYEDSYLDKETGIHMSDIYKVFAEILSSLSSELVVCTHRSQAVISYIYTEGKEFIYKSDNVVYSKQEYYTVISNKLEADKKKIDADNEFEDFKIKRAVNHDKK